MHPSNIRSNDAVKTTVVGFRWKLWRLSNVAYVADASSDDIVELGQHQTNERMTQQSQLHTTALWSRELNVFANSLQRRRATIAPLGELQTRLLHSKPSTCYSDDDCARLSSTFRRIFVDKLKRIGDTVPANLTSSSATTGIARPHNGPMLDDFRPVTTAEVQRLLMKMPAKSSLLKSCSDIFAVIIARLANLSTRDGLFLACLKTAEVLPLLVPIGQTSRTTGRFQTFRRSQKCSKDWHWRSFGHISSILRISIHFNPVSVPVTLQKQYYWNC